MWRMTKEDHHCSLLAGLAVCEALLIDPKTTTKGEDRQRARIDHVLSYVGKMRKDVLLAARELCWQVKYGDISAKQHGNIKTKQVAEHNPEPIVSRPKFAKSFRIG